jgi:hypothetical protein
MATKLTKSIKRELDLNDMTYTITIAPEGLKIVEKGKRKGQEIGWGELVRGTVTLGQRLEDSIAIAERQE